MARDESTLPFPLYEVEGPSLPCGVLRTSTCRLGIGPLLMHCAHGVSCKHARKLYARPRLARHGTLADITQAVGNMGARDNGGPGNKMRTG